MNKLPESYEVREAIMVMARFLDEYDLQKTIERLYDLMGEISNNK